MKALKKLWGGWLSYVDRTVRPIELVSPWLPPIVGAITLWPLILYREGNYEDDCVRAHEYYHWYEARRCLVLPWYTAYLLLMPFFTPWEHPLEREAYRVQKECENNG